MNFLLEFWKGQENCFGLSDVGGYYGKILVLYILERKV
jgi:hypothetical protein